MQFDDARVSIPVEHHLPLRREITAIEQLAEPGLQLVSAFDEEPCGTSDLAGGEEQIEIAEVSEGDITEEHAGRNGSFVRKSLDSIAAEQVEDRKQLARREKVMPCDRIEPLLQNAANFRRNGVTDLSSKMPVKEWKHSMRAGIAQDLIPIDSLSGQSPQSPGRSRIERTTGAADEKLYVGGELVRSVGHRFRARYTGLQVKSEAKLPIRNQVRKVG